MDLALNNLQRLICHKTNQTNKHTSTIHYNLQLPLVQENLFSSPQIKMLTSLFSTLCQTFFVFFFFFFFFFFFWSFCFSVFFISYFVDHIQRFFLPLVSSQPHQSLNPHSKSFCFPDKLTHPPFDQKIVVRWGRGEKEIRIKKTKHKVVLRLLSSLSNVGERTVNNICSSSVNTCLNLSS